MELNLKKWEAYMQQDPALQDRLQRLNPQGYPATRKGDLLCLKAGKRSIVVNWDGKQLQCRDAGTEESVPVLESRREKIQ